MTDTDSPLGRWEPAPLAEVVERFSTLRCPWWVAGGFAIELAVGRGSLREHSDTDVLLLRRDQLAAQEALAGWEWWAADPPGRLRPWAPGEILPIGVHDVWCRPGPDDPWRIQIMLDESSDGEWTSRRDPLVRRPVDTLGQVSEDGVPYLAPEVQLFYKARAPQAKDEADFAAVLPLLDDEQRAWLVEAVTQVYGPHPWVGRLREPGGRQE